MLKHSDILQWHGHGFDEVFKRRIMEPFISKCQRVIYDMPGFSMVVFTQARTLIGENNPFTIGEEGTSITNSIENCATLTVREFPKLHDKPIVWVEHYASPYTKQNPSRHEDNEETFAFVIFRWINQEQRFHYPDWTHTTRAAIEVLLREVIVT